MTKEEAYNKVEKTIEEYFEFVSLVKMMRDAQQMADRAMAEFDDYSEALIYINKAEELEKEVDLWLKGLEGLK